jgi:PiT family inorganic phosphate transporter
MGVLEKVVLPMICSPLIGGVIGFMLMSLIFRIFFNSTREKVSHTFHHLQRISAALMSFNHGQNDAQKTMGIITLALVAFHHIPGGDQISVPQWVMFACAAAMAFGTAAGGWRIIHTMGEKIIKLEPVHGFAANTAGSIVIFCASLMGMAVSTTHVISGSIFGVGVAKNLPTVKWNTAQVMVTAWGLTLPAAGIVAGIFFLILHISGHGSLAVIR